MTLAGQNRADISGADMDLSSLDIWNRVYWFFHRDEIKSGLGGGNESRVRPDTIPPCPDYLEREAAELAEGE